jgi:hypothetical protein
VSVYGSYVCFTSCTQNYGGQYLEEEVVEERKEEGMEDEGKKLENEEQQGD